MAKPVRKVTQEAFDAWIAEEGNEARVLELVAEGLHLTYAAKQVNRPYRCLHAYFHSSPEREERYLAARKAWADGKQDEAQDLADGVEPDRDHVAKAKLQIEVRQAAAKAYHRERWGEKLQVDKEVKITTDAVLLGTAGALLERLSKPKLVESLPAPLEVLEDGSVKR